MPRLRKNDGRVNMGGRWNKMHDRIELKNGGEPRREVRRKASLGMINEKVGKRRDGRVRVGRWQGTLCRSKRITTSANRQQDVKRWIERVYGKEEMSVRKLGGSTMGEFPMRARSRDADVFLPPGEDSVSLLPVVGYRGKCARGRAEGRLMCELRVDRAGLGVGRYSIAAPSTSTAVFVSLL